MAGKVYVGVNNLAKEGKKFYFGDSNNKAKAIDKIYVGVNNLAVQIFPSSVTPVSNSYIFEKVRSFYNLPLSSYQILNYSNSYSSYNEFVADLDNYKYIVVNYIHTSNSEQIDIYFCDSMWFQPSSDKIFMSTYKFCQFWIYQNIQGGYNQKAILRKTTNSSTQLEILPSSTTIKYIVYNVATSTAYDDFYGFQGGFNQDEIFTIRNGQIIS